jgi:predicted nucleic acid-binding protein
VITYVDTSTLIKLVIDEEGSDRAALICRAADALASVNLVVVEARAALGAALRSGRLTPSRHRRAKAEVTALIGDLYLAEVTENLVNRAADLAEREGLRAYDAVHVAAALDLGASVLTSTDEALCRAAARRGLYVANPLHS